MTTSARGAIDRFLSGTGTLAEALVSLARSGAPGAAGPPGPPGPAGANAYTTVTTGFVQPAALGLVTVEVASSAWTVGNRGGEQELFTIDPAFLF